MFGRKEVQIQTILLFILLLIILPQQQQFSQYQVSPQTHLEEQHNGEIRPPIGLL